MFWLDPTSRMLNLSSEVLRLNFPIPDQQEIHLTGLEKIYPDITDICILTEESKQLFNKLLLEMCLVLYFPFNLKNVVFFKVHLMIVSESFTNLFKLINFYR